MSAAAPHVLWLFGLPSAGKTTLARAVAEGLRGKGHTVCILDGDEMRSGVNADLGFSDADRSENLRRSAHIAKLLAGQGHTIIAAFVTPKEANRSLVRGILESTGVRLVHVDCPLEVCVGRDVKGLYAKASQKKMEGMTGTQDPFEPPVDVDLTIRTHSTGVAESAALLLDLWGPS
ncbi:MAG: adenylyl-sulfate kinase [Verrucomicrobiaceae bacterium]|nr:adenylyl-sulfate kinase [Verrucomicrobiaceae bacterium]